jgi:putative phosphoribosyl transferase
VCPMTPWPFFSIGEWYEDFSQTPDEEVVELLDKAKMFASSARRAE